MRRGHTATAIPDMQHDEGGLRRHAQRVVRVETGSNAITSAGEAAEAAMAG